ncbi:MAG: hypothetical protein Faunusvirus8_12 [Faunusvirus sp.]|jgi:hypothetical protein|uniref:Uncharacterized protein n=1 Tax=Faunusvirus sp. TaxID=2487766 RepID=A0A3G4ZWN4_9VIRU|nr:MAG: hypothetical protein Faunusvirus8_12 [Faunusvirus sp.]
METQIVETPVVTPVEAVINTADVKTDKPKKEPKYVDYLVKDPVRPSQRWACMSFLDPDGIANCKTRGIKIRGVFEDYEEAKKFAENIRKIADPDFHVYVGEVGAWLQFNQNPDTVEEEVFADKTLNGLMKTYKEKQAEAKVLYEKRKHELVQKNLEEQQKRKMKTKDREKSKDKNKKKKTHRSKSKSNTDDTAAVSASDSVSTSASAGVSTSAPAGPSVTENKEVALKETSAKLKQVDETLSGEQSQINNEKDKLKNSKDKLSNITAELEKMKQLYEKATK